MFRSSTTSTMLCSTWALSAANFGFLSPITIATLVVPWFIYQSYVAAITADDKTLDAVCPANTIIIFDLHGVLFRSDFLGMIKLILFSPCAGKVFLHIINPFFLYDIFKLYNHSYITEYWIFFLCKKYSSLQPCLPLFLRAANLQIPSWKTIHLVISSKIWGTRSIFFQTLGRTFLPIWKRNILKYFSLLMPSASARLKISIWENHTHLLFITISLPIYMANNAC